MAFFLSAFLFYSQIPKYVFNGMITLGFDLHCTSHFYVFGYRDNPLHVQHVPNLQ